MRQTHISWLVSALAALSWSCRVEPEPGEPPADPVADMSPASDMGGGDAADATADGRADFERDAGAEPAADMEVDAPADATPAAWVSRLGSAAMTGGFNPAGFGGTEVYRAIDVGPEGEVWGIATVAGPATGLDGQMVGEQGRVTSALVRWSARGELLGGTELRARGGGRSLPVRCRHARGRLGGRVWDVCRGARAGADPAGREPGARQWVRRGARRGRGAPLAPARRDGDLRRRRRVRAHGQRGLGDRDVWGARRVRRRGAPVAREPGRVRRAHRSRAGPRSRLVDLGLGGRLVARARRRRR